MRTFLVVANKTLGGEGLASHLRQVIENHPDSSFVVVVPFSPPVPLDVGGAMGGIAVLDIETEGYLEVAAQVRLDALLDWFKVAGADAQGEIVRSDPITAIERATRTHRFDEIIISTLPERLSRWLRMDLVHRASRKFDVPITTVIGTSSNELLPPVEIPNDTNAQGQDPFSSSTGKSDDMGESVYKIIELVGTSTESWEKAAAAAVSKAALSLRDLRVAEVAQLDLVIADGAVSAYRAKVKVSFKYDGDD